jgi:hypothetical protein
MGWWHGGPGPGAGPWPAPARSLGAAALTRVRPSGRAGLGAAPRPPSSPCAVPPRGASSAGIPTHLLDADAQQQLGAADLGAHLLKVRERRVGERDRLQWRGGVGHRDRPCGGVGGGQGVCRGPAAAGAASGAHPALAAAGRRVHPALSGPVRRFRRVFGRTKNVLEAPEAPQTSPRVASVWCRSSLTCLSRGAQLGPRPDNICSTHAWAQGRLLRPGRGPGAPCSSEVHVSCGGQRGSEAQRLKRLVWVWGPLLSRIQGCRRRADRATRTPRQPDAPRPRALPPPTAPPPPGRGPHAYAPPEPGSSPDCPPVAHTTSMLISPQALCSTCHGRVAREQSSDMGMSNPTARAGSQARRSEGGRRQPLSPSSLPFKHVCQSSVNLQGRVR